MEDVRSFVKLAQSLLSKSSECMAILGADKIQQMELYIILATLEKFECWNQALSIIASNEAS